MRIIAAQDQVLANVEVLQHIDNLRSRWKEEQRDATIPTNVHNVLGDVWAPLLPCPFHTFLVQKSEPFFYLRLNISSRQISAYLEQRLSPLAPGPGADLIRAKESNEYESNACFRQLKAAFQARKWELIWKRELLMIINLRPSVHEQLWPIIENCSRRFSNETLEEMISVIREVLGCRHLGMEVGEEGDDAEDEEGADGVEDGDDGTNGTNGEMEEPKTNGH